MAVWGLSTFLHAPLTESTGLYGTVAKTGGAIEAKLSINYNDGTIYTDNKLQKKDTSFKDGTLALIVGYADKAVLSPLIGKKSSAVSFTPAGAGATAVTSVKYTANSGDSSIPEGFGYIEYGYNPAEDADVYTVKFFPKVEFKPYTQDSKSKEGTKTYTYTTLEATIYELENGDWNDEVDFESESVAIEYLNSLFVHA